MPANNNAPLGLVPWRLTAQSPGTLDVRIDVEDPVSWDIGGTGPTFVDPITGSTYPVLTGLGLQQMVRKGQFKLFIPDTSDRDDVIEALIAARLDNVAPYYTWKAVDGSQSFKVRIDASEKLKIGFLGPYRTIDLYFIEVLSATGVAVVGTPPPTSTTPFVTSGNTTINNHVPVPVTWGGFSQNSPSDLIMICQKSNPNVDVTNQFGTLAIVAISGSNTVLFNDPSGETTYELRMYLGVGPRVVIGPTFTKTTLTQAQIYIQSPPNYANTTLSGGEHWGIHWGGISAPDASDHVVAEYFNGSSWVQFDSQNCGTVQFGNLTFTAPSTQPINFFTAVRFRLVTFADPVSTATGAGMSGPFAQFTGSGAGNVIEVIWAGVKVLGGARLGIIPAGDSDLTNAYTIVALPAECSTGLPTQHYDFDFGIPTAYAREGDLVRACIVEGDGNIILGNNTQQLVGS